MDVSNMSKTKALKVFFGDVMEVTNQELLDLRRADVAGYDELAELAKIELAKR